MKTNTENKSILLIYRIDQFESNSYGIFQKLNNQKRAWTSHGYNCDIITFDNKKISFNAKPILITSQLFINYSLISEFLFFHLIKLASIDFKKYDIVFIRHVPIAIGLKSLISHIKSNNEITKIILDLPTFPYLHEYSGIKKIIAKMLSPSKLNIDGITHLGNEMNIFGVPVIHVINSYDSTSVQPKTEFSDTKSEIKLIYIASLWRLLGLESFMKAIILFNNSFKNRRIQLTIVGNGFEKFKLIQLMKNFGMPSYIHLESSKYGQDLNEIINQHDLGVGAIVDINQLGINYTQALKHRMYAGYGLPFFTNVFDAAFINVQGVYLLENRIIDLKTIENIWNWYMDQIDNMQKISHDLRLFTEKNLVEDRNIEKIITFVDKLQEFG